MPRNKKYKRLPGQKRAMFAVSGVSRYSLWAADDHLIYIENEGYMESCKRFYYRDIQAFIARKTVLGQIMNLALSVFTAGRLIWLLHAINREWHIAAIIILGIITGLFAVSLPANILKGATCVFFIRTAVQTERIRSIERMRTAMKVIKMLSERIASEQGNLTHDHITMMQEEIIRQEEDAKIIEAQAKSTREQKKKKQPLKPYASNAHLVLFMLLLADFAHNCLQFLYTDPNMYLSAVALTLAIVTSDIFALVKQTRTRIWTGIKTLTWIVPAYLTALYFLNNIMVTFFSITRMPMDSSSWKVYREIYSMSPFDSWFRMIMLLFGAVCSGALGGIGLIMLNRFNKSEQAGDTAANSARE